MIVGGVEAKEIGGQHGGGKSGGGQDRRGTGIVLGELAGIGFEEGLGGSKVLGGWLAVLVGIFSDERAILE